MKSIDFKNALENKADNFGCKLFQLMLKADHQNLERLAMAYPVEASMVLTYRRTGRIPDTE